MQRGFKRKFIKITPALLTCGAICLVNPLISFSKANLSFINRNHSYKSVLSVNTVLDRFLSDVENNHTNYLNQYLSDFKNMPKSTIVESWACRGWGNWQHQHDYNFKAKDIYGDEFINSKPRLLSNQNNYSVPSFVSEIAHTGDFWDSKNEWASWATYGGHDKMADGWVNDKKDIAWQNAKYDIFEFNRENRNKNFDIGNLAMSKIKANISERRIHNDGAECGDWANNAYANTMQDFYNKCDKNRVGNLMHIKTACQNSFGNHFWACALWYYLIPNDYLNIKYLYYGLNNVFQIKDFGFDNENGYYYTLGLNEMFFTAVEGEKLNPQVKTWWEKELIGRNRPEWIEDFSQSQPAFEKIRDVFFKEVEKLINERVITYDNYDKVKKYVHDISTQSRQCPALGWLTNEISSNANLQNNGWPQLSKNYGLENCPDVWDILVLILPELHYSIHYDRNSNPDQVDGGEWEDLQEHQESYDWKTLSNGAKIPLGYDGKNSVAFKAEVDVITERNKNAPMHVDTWRGNFDAEGKPIDTNLTNNLLPIDFIFDKTVQLEIDPKNEHKDHKDTYWHFDKTMKKLCNVQHESNKILSLKEECEQYLPSYVWNQLSGTISEKLQEIIVDENKAKASVFAFKNIQGEYDYNIKDECLKVEVDDKNGALIVKLINPTDKMIVSTAKIDGFKKDEGYSDIVLPFGKLFSTMTGKTTENIQVQVLNPKADTTLEYAVEDESIASVSCSDTTGRVLKIQGISDGITKVNVQLKDSGSMVISTTEFWIYVDIKPEAMEINQPFENINLKEGNTGIAEEGSNFKVDVFADKEKKSKECLQFASFKLINAPEWVGITNSLIWQDPETGETKYLDSGYIYVVNAQIGTYTFSVEATNSVDETLKVASKSITLKVVKDEPPEPKPTPKPKGLSTGAIAAIATGGVVGVSGITGFSIYTIKRRKK